MGFVILIVVMLLSSAAMAHDPKRPELNGWFNGLHNGIGGQCCSNMDGKVVLDADWDSKDGHYRVRIDGEWIDVPDDAVIKEPNLYGPTVVWPKPSSFYGAHVKTTILCFLPGSMT